MKRFIIFLPIFLLLSEQTNCQVRLVNFGSSWAYYDNQNKPKAQQDIEWYENDYSPIWPTGYAHFGYGDNDETTLLNPKTRTAYFRNTFNVKNPSSYTNLDLHLIYDDGAVIFLNGIEVWRVNMPKRVKSYWTLAKEAVYDNSRAKINIENALIPGTNVLAVEIHQWHSNSSDISFDMRLIANAPGAVKITMGPILYKISPTSIIVKWKTAEETESIINYGLNQSNLKYSASDLTAKTKHELRIDGLLENTVYYYEISNSAVALIPAASDIYFKTPPAINASIPTSAWVQNGWIWEHSDEKDIVIAH